MSVILHETPVRAKPFVVPVPKAEFIPRTEASVPFNTADRQTDPFDLKQAGYVEEEYFLSGSANLYCFGPDITDPTYVKAENAPYKDRILVRKPADAKNFSGTVLVEMMNYAFRMDVPEAGWGALSPYLLSRGDAWVGLTIRDEVIATLKRYDEVRYGTLSLPNPIPAEKRGEIRNPYNFKVNPENENGLIYDIMSQTAALIRSGNEDSPFRGYDVRFLFATGASAGDLTTYAGFVHDFARREDGGTVFDGIQIFMTGSPNTLNNEEMNILAPHPLSIIDPKTPCFRVLTLGDLLGGGGHPDWSALQRRDDRDDPLYRVYEIAGAGLGIRRDMVVEQNREESERCGARWKDRSTKLPFHAFPTQMVLRACFHNLKEYCERGILPPRAERIETTGTYPEMDFVLDEYGNAKGGVRYPFVDVPIARYGWDGTVEPFDRARLRSLYKDHADYVKQVAAACEEQVKQRFLLPEDAVSLIEQALRFDLDRDDLIDAATGRTGENTYGM